LIKTFDGPVLNIEPPNAARHPGANAYVT